MEQIRNFDQLLQAALAHGRKGIAVAAPYDKNTLLAVKDALASGLAAPQLFGDVERMLPLLEQVQLDAGVHSPSIFVMTAFPSIGSINTFCALRYSSTSESSGTTRPF